MNKTLMYEGKKSEYYLIDSLFDDKRALQKQYRQRGDNERLALNNLQHELDTTNAIDCAGLRKTYEITTEDNSPILLVEHIEGEMLDRYFQNRKKNKIELFFSLTRKLLTIVEDIHKKYYVHQKLTAEHIIVGDDEKVTIINPSAALYCGLLGRNIASEGVLNLPLSHLAPEQTGRIFKNIDYRTDIYNLGVTFYGLLAGKYPFDAEDPYELIYSHLAKKPEYLHRLSADIPETLGLIINKMLEKAPEERYQSVYGLKNDLQECEEEYKRDGKIRLKKLGQKDISGQLAIPDKLYGREQELNLIRRLVDEVKNGTAEIVTITGPAGIGKTSLVHEIKSMALAEHGIYLEGKFGQFNRNVPYKAWIEAFSGFVQILLSLDKKTLEKWQAAILEKIGINGKIITDVLPGLELIIGKQPDLPILGAAEAQNLFGTVFEQFIAAIAQKENPLYIFLDDLQWIDSASLELLNTIVSKNNVQYVLFIGAFRDNEVDPQHPLYIAFQSIKKQFRNLQEIGLKPISKKAINHLISDTTKSDVNENEPVAKVIFEKTGGNPFFVHQLIHTLFQQNILSFNTGMNRWEWDTETLVKSEITDNVVDLMIAKIKKLSDIMQRILQYASCIGTYNKIHILSLLANLPEHDFKYNLQLLKGEGLLTITNTSFQFVHDKVQQAAYATINDHEKSKIHLQIGLYLSQKLDESNNQELIFEIVDQINLGNTQMLTKEQSKFVAELSLQAGINAASNTANSAALKYFKSGINLLQTDSWESQYQLCLDLYTEAVRSAYICGKYETMMELRDTIHKNARSVTDESTVYDIEVKALAAQAKLLDAIGKGVHAIQEIGMEIPNDPDWDYVWGRFNLALEQLNKIGIEHLSELPLMTSETDIAITRILSALGEPAYAAAPNFFILWASEYGLKVLTARHNVFTPFGFAAFALALCASGQHIEAGYALATKAVELVDHPEARSSRCRVLNIYGGTIQFWKAPLRNSIPIMEKAVTAGYENGDHTSGSYATFGMSMNLFQMGENLSIIEEKLVQNLHTLKYFKQDFLWNWVTVYLHSIRELQATVIHQPPLEHYDDIAWVKEATETNNIGGLGHYYLNRLIVSFILSAKDKIMDYAELTDKNAAGFQSTINVPTYKYYYSLSVLKTIEPGTEIPEIVFENQRYLESLSLLSAANYLHKYELVEAEIARLRGERWDAAQLYHNAIQHAHKSSYLQDEAVACELAAEFYFSEEHELSANFFIKQAYEGYKKWGAKAKLKQLEEKYVTHFIRKPFERETAEGDLNIDVQSIMHAAQHISGEMQIDKLIDALMDVLIRNAGAQNCYLILKEDDNLFLEARISSSSAMVERDLVNIEQLDYIPLSIINYVVRTKKSLLVHDAEKDGMFSADPAVDAKGLKSVLCIPLLVHGEISGILLFENSLMVGAFSDKHESVLKMLATQAAISIENASLYSKLLYENEERKRSELKYRLLAENTTDIISRHEIESLKYLYASPSSEQVLGFEPEEMIGHSALEFIHPDDHDYMIKARAELYIKGTTTAIFRKRKKDGTYIWAESNNRIIKNQKGEVVELVAVTRDISVRKQYEDTLKENERQLKLKNEEYLVLNEELSESNTRILEINEELKSAIHKAEESDRLKSAFLANISHEIRTPMNGILGFANLLTESDLTKESYDLYITLINKSGERLLNLINDLVDISKIEAGIVELNYATFDLVKLLDENYQLFRIETDKSGIALINENQNHSPFYINSDQAKLNQILANLLKNAIKFTRKGSIRFGFNYTDTHVTMYVADTGSGINKDVKDYIFDRFRQGDTALTREYEGAGLGLYICKSNVDLLKGEIGFESELGKGTKFTFSIPVNIAKTKLAVPEKSPSRIPDIPNGIKVLIAEDDDINYLYLEQILIGTDIQICHAWNGKEAIEMIDKCADFNLVLMDIKMPVMDGYHAFSVIKSKWPHLPVFAQTAYALKSDIEKIKQYGFDEYLAKPINKDELLRKISFHIRMG